MKSYKKFNMLSQENHNNIVDILNLKYSNSIIHYQQTMDEFQTIWIKNYDAQNILRFLMQELKQPFNMLYDLTAIDERMRKDKNEFPGSDFTIVYHLLSFERNQDVRIKVPLNGEYPETISLTDFFPMANWYEREIWDLFGIKFAGHPNLQRILLPKTWKGHPLRKEHPARATEIGSYKLSDEKQDLEQDALMFNPDDWYQKETEAQLDKNFIFLNLGPQHPGTHGVLRVILKLDGEKVVDAIPDIGFHHRGAEKMAERQTWHTYIPYTDRIDYLSGVLNNFPYILAVEKLAGIEVPDRVKVIRVMLAEIYRIASHLVWFGTYAADVGALSPVFFMFNDREHIFSITEAICGARMHPSWFRIGGVAQDLPKGWQSIINDFLQYMPKRLKEYENLVMKNRILKMRLKGIGAYTKELAIEWGVTGPGLRACGFDWDLRKKRPYSGYEHFEFDIPVAFNGDCYDRGVVRVEEIRQSLKIIKQCVKNMPSGTYKSEHPLSTPPLKEKTMYDIETLITHFLGVSWGPVMPAGEAFAAVESSKGNCGYYLISDKDTVSYRTRIRTPSFPHIQMLPLLCKGHTIADVAAILGSIDYVLSDIDR